jgi:protein gp37
MKLDPESRRAKWTELIVKDRKIIGSTMSRETARNLFSHLKRDEFEKDIPREIIKEYRKGIRFGTQPDPWRNL